MNIQLTQAGSDIYIPAGNLTPEAALARTTHLSIMAHQDDTEFWAYHGIQECFGRDDLWFTGIVLTDGAGSSRTGAYAAHTDAQMRDVRRIEQRKAAFVGGYSAMLQLHHPSSAAKDARDTAIQADLAAILAHCSPRVVYLHQPADKHDTHVGACLHALKALRALPPARRPGKVYGCEGWRDLDWLCDTDKQLLDSGRSPNLAAALSGVFDSQIAGGKRYDLGVAGRRLGHATMHESHAADAAAGITWAVDLTPLVQTPALPVADFILAHIERFRADVAARLARLS